MPISIMVAIVVVAANANSIMASEFKYKPVLDPKNQDKILCLDSEGNEGLNKIQIEEVIETKIGYCGGFYNVQLNEGTDLKGVDLRGSFFATGSLAGVDMSGADLRSASINMVDAYGINLQGADLTGAQFLNSIISQANMSNIKMTGKASLHGSTLVNTDMTGARLDGIDFGGILMVGPGASLKNASLVGADLSYSVFIDKEYGYVTNMDETNLQDAIFNDYTKLPYSDEEASRRGMVKVQKF